MFDIKDHEIRELVSAVTDAARKYEGAGCMRDVMARIIGGYLKDKRENGLIPFEVSYEGLWIGGTAVVMARNAEEAVELVRNHENTCMFNHVTVKALPCAGVIHNDNGDY